MDVLLVPQLRTNMFSVPVASRIGGVTFGPYGCMLIKNVTVFAKIDRDSKIVRKTVAFKHFLRVKFGSKGCAGE